MEKVTSASPACAPVSWELARDNEGAARIYRVLLKWIRFAKEEYREWPERPRCGHFFGGAYWYGLETAGTALVFAIAASQGRFDEALAGASRDDVRAMAVGAIRYLGFTHDAGPEECVRARSTNPVCSGTKWGGRDDPYFQATQTGVALNQFALAAWLLWDALDAETRALVKNATAAYADRWAADEPRPGAYVDTQCEENAWTGLGIATGAYLFPDDPRAAGWLAAAKRWALAAVGAPRDRIELGPRAPVTFHPDWTAENHAFVHPTYMAAGINLRSSTALLALMRGEPVPDEVVRHYDDLYEHTLLPWTHTDGMAVPVQGQSWWYNRQHEALHTHVAMAALRGHPAAPAFAEDALETIERLQDSNDRGCLLEQNGEALFIVKKDYQTAKDMEHNAVVSVAKAYLISRFGGAAFGDANGVGDAARGERPARRGWRGVRTYPFGGVVVHRTERTFSSFSWRNHVMALTLPERGLWDVTPLFASYTGTFAASDASDASDAGNAEDAAAAQRDEYVIEPDRCETYVYPDGFGALARLSRAGGRLRQETAFVSLPDGRSVYIESVEATRACRVAEHRSGLIGVRNERYAALPDRARGEKTVWTAGGGRTFEGYYGRDPDVSVSFGATPWANLDGRIGYVLFGSPSASYVNRHEYAKWKGVEDTLVLNDRAPYSLAAGERAPAFVVLTAPNADAAETARQASGAALWTTARANVVLAETGSELVYANFGEAAALADGEAAIAGRPMPIYAGASSYDPSTGTLRWRGELPMRQSGYVPRLGSIEASGVPAPGASIDVVAAAGAIVIRHGGAFGLLELAAEAFGRTARFGLLPGESVVLTSEGEQGETA